MFVALYLLLCNCLWLFVIVWSGFGVTFFFGFIFKEIKWDHDSRMSVLNCYSEFVRVVFGSHCSVICEYC